MKTISPWFQTAALMSAIRHASCNLETARPDRSSDMQPIVVDRARLFCGREEVRKIATRFGG